MAHAPLAGPLRRDRARFFAEMLLPYGVVELHGGVEVLFNRAYRPLYRRPVGATTAEPVGPDDMEPRYRITRYVYVPPETPARDAGVRRRCLTLLAEWGVPMLTEADIPAAWELYRDAFAPSL